MISAESEFLVYPVSVVSLAAIRSSISHMRNAGHHLQGDLEGELSALLEYYGVHVCEHSLFSCLELFRLYTSPQENDGIIIPTEKQIDSGNSPTHDWGLDVFMGGMTKFQPVIHQVTPRNHHQAMHRYLSPVSVEDIGQFETWHRDQMLKPLSMNTYGVSPA